MGFTDVNKDDDFMKTLSEAVVIDPSLTDDDVQYIDDSVTISTDVDQFVTKFVTR